MEAAAVLRAHLCEFKLELDSLGWLKAAPGETRRVTHPLAKTSWVEQNTATAGEHGYLLPLCEREGPNHKHEP